VSTTPHNKQAYAGLHRLPPRIPSCVRSNAPPPDPATWSVPTEPAERIEGDANRNFEEMIKLSHPLYEPPEWNSAGDGRKCAMDLALWFIFFGPVVSFTYTFLKFSKSLDDANETKDAFTTDERFIRLCNGYNTTATTAQYFFVSTNLNPRLMRNVYS
jgi:hypothetical protein